MIVREILPGIAAVKLQLSGLQGCAEVMVHGLAPTCRRRDVNAPLPAEDCLKDS